MIKTDKRKERKTTKRMPVWHREEVIDKETGELINRYNFEIEERDANFHKIWLCHVAYALDLIGNQKIKILSYILENTNSDNIFVGTQRIIAEETETALDTVNITMKMLMDADIIQKKHAGAYFINPNVMFKGGTNKRMDIVYKYQDTSSKRKKEAKAETEDNS